MSAAPATIGGYTLETKLGSGGMGAVYRASHPRFPDQRFALKVLLADGAPTPEEGERFAREMKALSTVTAHPNIVRIFGGSIDGGRPFYVMELVEGKALNSLLKEGGLEPRRAAMLLRTIADAVAYIHDKGIVHRDLKPENILVQAGDVPRICDFGLAKIAESERLTRSGAIFGTPSYSAPEQLDGHAHAADHRADVYSLGAVLWFTLVGRPPIVADSGVALLQKVLVETPDAPSIHVPAVPIALDAICLHALEKERGRRYATAAELRDDLDRFLRGEPVKAPALSSLDGFARAAKSREVRLGIRGALIVLAGMAATATATGFAVRDYGRRRDVERRYAAALEPGAGTSAVADALEYLKARGASPDQVSAVTRRLAERGLVDAVSAARASLTVATAVALGKAAIAAPGSACLVGETIPGDATGGFVLADALLRAQDAAASRRESADVARVVAVTNDLVAARLAARPGDPAARLLRALSTLASEEAPREALGGGRVGVTVTPDLVSDLAAARALAGAPGKRAAWLLADLLVARPEDDLARAALDAAVKSHPDEALAAKLGAVLSAPRDSAGFGRARVLGPFALARFLARCGMPDALERPDLDDAGVDRVLAREEASPERRKRFDLREDLESSRNQREGDVGKAFVLLNSERIGGRSQLTKETVLDTGKVWADQLRAAVDPHQKEIDELLVSALKQQIDQIVLAVCADPARARLTSAVFAVLGARIDLDMTASLFEGFCEDGRRLSRNFPMQDTFFADVWETEGKVGLAACQEWEARLAKDLAEDPTVAVCRSGGLGEDIDAAASAVKGLRRLEELAEHPPADPAERDELVFGALQGVEKLASLGGPTALPYRARLRLLAFDGALGGALASLDLRRALRFSGHVAPHPGVLWPSCLARIPEYFMACAEVAAEHPDRTPRLAEELLSGLIEWVRERAVGLAFDPSLGPVTTEKRVERLVGFLSDTGSDQSKPAYGATRDRFSELVRAHRLDRTPEDERRVREPSYVFRPHVLERSR